MARKRKRRRALSLDGAGHKKLYKQTGITKQAEDLVFSKKKMKKLVDWMTRRHKPRDEDKKWVPVAEIPKQFRPKLGQILQTDWQRVNPYPGWVLMVEQGGSGWKCKLMNNKEKCEYEEEKKNRNPKAQRWENEFQSAEMPRAVTPLRIGSNYNDKKPSVFVLTPTNGKNKKQWEATCQNLEKIGLEIVPVLGLDGEDIPYVAQAWNRAQKAWALKGFPFILKCLSKTDPSCGQQNWFIIAEDSAKLSPQTNIETIQSKLRSLPQGIEILLIGEKFFTATRMGIKHLAVLVHHRLLKGKQEDFNTSMGELISAKVAIGDARFLTGCRKQGGKWQLEEVPDHQTKEEIITDLQADWWTSSS